MRTQCVYDVLKSMWSHRHETAAPLQSTIHVRQVGCTPSWPTRAARGPKSSKVDPKRAQPFQRVSSARMINCCASKSKVPSPSNRPRHVSGGYESCAIAYAQDTNNFCPPLKTPYWIRSKST